MFRQQKFTQLLIILLFSFSPFQAFAQSDHTVLLYSHPLDLPEAPQFAEMTNRDGSFISGKGWEATSNSSQLYIKLPKDLPDEGTLIINVTNFDPVTQNQDDKQQIINLYSQNNGSKEIFNTDGSWWNIRTGYPYSDGPGMAGFKFLAAPRGIGTRDEERCIQNKNDWDIDHQYEFKVVWTLTTISCYLDGVLMSELPFQGQVQHFQYIFIGTDNVYTAQPGPIYSNLRIYSSEVAIAGSEISFSDVTTSHKATGFSDSGYGHGVSFADVDGDGYYDIFCSNAIRDQALPDLLLMNQGGNWFSEQANQRGTEDEGLTHSITSGDIDNDGDLDVFFSDMSVYADKHGGYGRNELYQNDGSGHFTDVSNWGISSEENDSRGAMMLDINNDGWLDIYAVNWGSPCEMYLNEGNGHMQRVDRGANGPAGDASSKQGVTAADFDNDGDIDIYVCRREAANWLFVNDGSGHFSERAAEYGVDYGGRSHGATFADIDNDGDLDLFVVNYAYSTGDLPQMGVYINNGDGSFTDKTKEYDIRVSGYSLAFGDVDNDADLDMLLAYNNDKDPGAVPRLLINNGAGQFTRVTCGVEVPTQDPRGLGYGDIDNDGDIDFYIACKDGHNFLLQNDYEGGNHFIDVLCIGPKGDYGGFGSKVTVYEPGYLGDAAHILGYQESVSNYAYLCQNQTALHFGLRNFTTCDIRIVRTDGQVFDYQNIAADQLFEMDQQPPESFSLIGVSGDNQSGEPGAQLAEPFVVRVQNQDGTGIADVNVTFAPQNGGSMVEPQPVMTDADGYARSTFVLGENAGSYEIWTSSEKTGSTTVVFQAQATTPDTFRLHYVSGDNQTGEPGQPLADPFVVRITNQNDGGLQGAVVHFTPQNGGSMIDSTVVTDADGYARGEFVLGNAEGDYAVIASSDAADSTATFHASAVLVHNNITIIKNYGDEQSGVVGQTLDSPVVVKAVDDQGRAVPDVAVTFMAQDGAIDGDSTKVDTTDADGKARASWTLGIAAGRQQLSAQYGDTELIFSATALADEPTLLTKSAPVDTLFQAGKSYTFQCAATDQYGNATPDVDVAFSVLDGNGLVNGDSTATTKTDSSGIASASWRLGFNHTWHNVLRAEIAADPDVTPVEFELDSIAPPRLDKSTVTTNKDSVAADGIDEAKITIILKDELGQPLPDYAVSLTVSGANNNLTLDSQASDSSGTLTARLTSSTVGEKIVTASVPGVGEVVDNAIIHFIPPPPGQMYLTKVSGDSQIAVVAHTLPRPLKVKVINSQETPLAGEKVVFEVKNNLGTLGDGWKQIVASNDSGLAEISLTLGERAGTWNHRVVTYLEADSAAVEFVATALADTAAVLARLTPDSLTVQPADTLNLAVRLMDRFSNPIAGADIIFLAADSDSFLTKVPTSSNSVGVAIARVVIGETAGIHSILAQYAQVRTTFTIFVVNEPEYLAYVSNDSIMFASLEDHIFLAVRARDAGGAPRPGVVVQFAIQSGSGQLRDSLVVSDSSGLAATTWTPTDMMTSTIVKAASPHDSLFFILQPQLISAVEKNVKPTQFRLGDNYPNPFNPATTIPFILPRAMPVRLRILDINGRTVATLVDGMLSAGEHTLRFNAKDVDGETMPSGIYFYQLETEGFTATKRLLLIK